MGEASYGAIATYAMATNYIIGAGMLAIPYGFRQSGIGLGIVCVVLTGVATIVTAMFEVETEHIVFRLLGSKQDVPGIEETTGLLQAADIEGVEVVEIAGEAAEGIASVDALGARPPVEVVRQIEVLWGHAARVAYIAALLFYFYVSLWAYAAVFAESMTALVPLGHSRHNSGSGGGYSESVYLWLLIFALLVVPMSLMNIAAQAGVQMFLTGVRYLTLLLMLAVPLVSLYTTPSADDAQHRAPHAPHVADGSETLWKPSGMGIACSNALYAFVFQHSVPGILAPLADKRRALVIFSSVVASLVTVYCLLGIVSVLYFGESVDPSININYKRFTYGYSSVPTWGRVLNFVIVASPAASFLSQYPLIAITLRNSILAMLPDSWRGEARSSRALAMRIVCGLMSALPPISGALVLRNLAEILEWAAPLSIFIGMVVPVFLWGAARRRRLPDGDSPHAWIGFNLPTAGAALVYSAAVLVFFIVDQAH